METVSSPCACIIHTQLTLFSSSTPLPWLQVYGVEIPNHDGRAGMAALTLAQATPQPFSLKTLAATARASLPAYAVPLFVRILPAVPATSTFKHLKSTLREEGADPSKCPDPVYVLSEDSAVGYDRLTTDRWAQIIAGKARI